MVSELIVKVLEMLCEAAETLDLLDEIGLDLYELETLKLLVSARMELAESIMDLEDALEDTR